MRSYTACRPDFFKLITEAAGNEKVLIIVLVGMDKVVDRVPHLGILKVFNSGLGASMFKWFPSFL